MKQEDLDHYTIAPLIKDGDHHILLRYGGNVIARFDGWPTLRQLLKTAQEFDKGLPPDEGNGDE